MARRSQGGRADVPDADHAERVAGMVDLLRTLFSDTAAQHAYDLLAGRDPLAGAITRDPTRLTWRAWRAAKRDIARGDPLAGWQALLALNKRAPMNEQPSSLAELERLALIAQCLALGHQVLPALEHTRGARRALMRFAVRLGEQLEACTRELRAMLAELTASNWTEDGADRALLQAWVIGRAIPLLISLAQGEADLGVRLGADVDTIAADLEADAARLQATVGAKLDATTEAQLRFALGNLYTENKPALAAEHFDHVAHALGLESGLGLQAAANAAHCLMRTERLAEAEARLGSLESLFEMRGDRSGAARVWISECVARWKRLHDPDVRRSLVGAIAMFEDTLRGRGDPMTRYVDKRYVEPGYLLLVAAIADGPERNDDALDVLLGAVWALQSRDLLADPLPQMPAEPWRRLLAQQRRPLAITRTMLEPLPDVGIVHLLSVTDRVVWLAYAADRKHGLRLECQALGEAHAQKIGELLRLMHEQLEADRVGDALGVASLGDALARTGEAIAADLSPALRTLLTSVRCILHLPHAYGNVDEFPLGALRWDGQWLAQRTPVLRAATVNQLRELLSPRRCVWPQHEAFVFTGDTSAPGARLAGIDAERSRAMHRLLAVGFAASVHETAGRAVLSHWLEGGAGALHYIGHGLANEVIEGLPLVAGEQFGPLDIDQLEGHRVPFVFLCACLAARLRAGSGGYHTGIASRLLERGSPGVLAFTMPVIEDRAYALAQIFYRAAARAPLGEAVRETQTQAFATMPAYAVLALAAHGDPGFELAAMAGAAPVPLLAHAARSWQSTLCAYCVLRTADSASALRGGLGEVPEPLRTGLAAWLDTAFASPPADTTQLDALQAMALAADTLPALDRLCVRAAVAAQRLNAAGADKWPLPETVAAQRRTLVDEANFIAELGAALFDMPLNALGLSLAARLYAHGREDAQEAALYLRQSRQQLRPWEGDSAFVARLRAEDLTLLERFGLQE